MDDKQNQGAVTERENTAPEKQLNYESLNEAIPNAGMSVSTLTILPQLIILLPYVPDAFYIQHRMLFAPMRFGNLHHLLLLLLLPNNDIH